MQWIGRIRPATCASSVAGLVRSSPNGPMVCGMTDRNLYIRASDGDLDAEREVLKRLRLVRAGRSVRA